MPPTIIMYVWLPRGTNPYLKKTILQPNLKPFTHTFRFFIVLLYMLLYLLSQLYRTYDVTTIVLRTNSSLASEFDCCHPLHVGRNIKYRFDVSRNGFKQSQLHRHRQATATHRSNCALGLLTLMEPR